MQRHALTSGVFSLGLIAMSAVLLGCVSINPLSEDARAASRIAGDDHADDRRPAGDPADTVWPARWGDADPELGKGVVVPVAGPLDAWSPRRHGPWHSRLPKGDDERLVAALAKGRTDAEGYRFRMEGYGAFVFERDPEVPVPEPGAPIARSDPSMMFVFVSGQVENEEDEGPAGERGPRVGIERTWFAFYDHTRGGTPEPGDPGLGTVMLLPGLFGIPEQVVDIVTSAMRQRGWNVIRMLAPPARFVEKSNIELDPDDADSPAEAAGELMHRIAETAYAAQGAWNHVLAERDYLADLPKVVFGGSGGALALPAVVRREPARYDAAVIVAGGANILDVVSESTYTKPVQALDFGWKGYDATPPAEVLDAFTEKYLDHAPLDGYHAGGWIDGTPVLMLQASGDRAVPVENSELLWEQLGEPEKWTINGNHMTLFLSLWLHTPRILDWLDGAIPAINGGAARPGGDP